MAWRLPRELTKLVLSMLRGNKGDYADLCSATRVCKEWKDAGDTALYEEVYIDDLGQLKALKARLLRSAYVNKKPLGNLIRGLCLYPELENEDDEAVMTKCALIDAVTSILLQTPGIHTYKSNDCLPLTPAILMCMPATTLTHLDVWMKPDTEDVFPILNTLRKLEYLNVDFLEGLWIHPVEHALSMPALMDITWVYEKHSSLMLKFLSRCVFGSGCLLQIEMTWLRSDQAHLLKPLFKRNSFGTLRISLPPEVLAILAPEIMDQVSVTFFDSMPPPGMLTKLPPELVLYLPDTRDTFWAFLHDLSVSEHYPEQKSTICTIYIWYTDNDMFDWLGDEADVDYTLFIGRLLKIAVLLYRRGVIIEDVNDRDVMTLV